MMRAFGRVNFGEAGDTCDYVSGVDHYVEKWRGDGDECTTHLGSEPNKSTFARTIPCLFSIY